MAGKRWEPVIWAILFFGTKATSQLWLGSFRVGRELGVSFSGKEGFLLAPRREERLSLAL